MNTSDLGLSKSPKNDVPHVENELGKQHIDLGISLLSSQPAKSLLISSVMFSETICFTVVNPMPQIIPAITINGYYLVL